ncbi:NADH-quinone oxidoreductase subunit C [Streptomyces sp. NPDC048187]|uniref:NADH-quinone oxidoreductase subunit C n=1 Tax=Streptomyces sp. NPDC048187 TaxID=3365509 RepID=UPI00371501F9
MSTVGWLPADAEEVFGTDATAEESYDLLTVDVPPASWITALETARDRLGCTYFDWLSAVDEPGTGFRVAAHVAALGPVRRLLLRTTVPHEEPVLPTAVGVYAGAAWHERETHEMFGVAFADHPGLDHLLLPEGFEGHPLRKDFVLAARVAKAWPGAKEPGESDHGGPRRRQMLPPGVPDPNEWGPLKGQLPPAPARPARGAGRAAGERPARAAGERPARRTRTAAEGSVGQRTEPPGTETPAAPRRSRTAAEGSVSQGSPAPAEPTAAPAPRRSRSASQGSASQRVTGPTDGPALAVPPGSTGDTAAGAPQEADGSGAAPADGAPRTDDGPAPLGERPGGAAADRRSRSGSQRSASRRDADRAGQPDHEGSGRAPGDGGDTDTVSPPAREPAGKPAPAAPRSPDAPWHHARPAFDDPEAPPEDASQEADTPGATQSSQGPDTTQEPDASPGPSQGPDGATQEADAFRESDVPREPDPSGDGDTPADRDAHADRGPDADRDAHADRGPHAERDRPDDGDTADDGDTPDGGDTPRRPPNPPGGPQ